MNRLYSFQSSLFDWSAHDHNSAAELPYMCEANTVPLLRKHQVNHHVNKFIFAVEVRQCDYFYHDTSKTWTDARKFGKVQNNGVLATVDSAEVEERILAS